MREDVKQKWLEELRSNKWKKGTGSLAPRPLPHSEDNRRCCLGVLCEVAKREGAIEDYDPDEGLLPDAVFEWAGLTAPDPAIELELLEESNNRYRNFYGLADLNDDILSGQNFTFIAQVIEDQL